MIGWLRGHSNLAAGSKLLWHLGNAQPAEAVFQKPHLFLCGAGFFRDVHDFVLKNKQIGLTFARQPHHVLVVVFNPAHARSGHPSA